MDKANNFIDAAKSAMQSLGIKAQPALDLNEIKRKIAAGLVLSDKEFAYYETLVAQTMAEGPEKEISIDQLQSPGTTTLDATLAERGSRYGKFSENSKVYTQIMAIVISSPNAQAGRLDAPTLHALGNIATKLARLLTGDPTYYDNWRDIAGYATLMEKICNGEDR